MATITTLTGMVDSAVFVTGYTPTGVDVGSEFTQLINKINEVITQLNTNTSAISTNASGLLSLTASVATNTSAIATNTSAISLLDGTTESFHQESFGIVGYTIPDDFEYTLLEVSGTGISTVVMPDATAQAAGRKLKIVSSRGSQTAISSGDFTNFDMDFNDVADFVVVYDNAGTTLNWVRSGWLDASAL